MDSILSSVLSIFSHNPIFVLGIIAYIAFSIIKNKNTEESEEYDEYESSSGCLLYTSILIVSVQAAMTKTSRSSVRDSY